MSFRTTQAKITPGFLVALDAWIVQCQEIMRKYWEKQQYTHVPIPIIVRGNMGSRYCVIWVNDEKKDQERHSRIYAFVEIATGDVFKPATWRAPAKHARGNIYEPETTANYMTAHGPVYLK